MVDPTGLDAEDFFAGAANGVVSGFLLGMGRSQSGNADFQRGQFVADLSMVYFGAGVEAPAGLTVGGGSVLLEGASAGGATPVAVPGAVGGALATAHGVAVAGVALGNAVEYIMAAQGGPNGGPRPPEHQRLVDERRRQRAEHRENASRDAAGHPRSGEGSSRDTNSASEGPSGSRPKGPGGRNRERNRGIDEEHSRVPEGKGGRGAGK
jgi:hypothetical protein